jgi:biotin synthase-related radical SAM superfamily protein
MKRVAVASDLMMRKPSAMGAKGTSEPRIFSIQLMEGGSVMTAASSPAAFRISAISARFSAAVLPANSSG